jgi:hypothetical protein
MSGTGGLAEERPDLAEHRVGVAQPEQVVARRAAPARRPDGPAARRRDAGLARLTGDLAWIHGYDALAPVTGRGARCSAAAG